MPPALPSPAPSRPWWSRSKSSKDSLRPNRSVSSFADEDDKFLSTHSTTTSNIKDALPVLKFKTIASAVGLKSKKLPSLTIQDPPSPVAPSRVYSNSNSRPGSGHSGNNFSPPPSAAFYTNRPPAKSVSTVRSSEYDYDAASEPHSEPRTPSDHPRDRLSYQHSVMTFSEIDPFASGGIVVQHLPQDPNRLSAYSDSSMLDPQQKRADIPSHNRASYGSSSSNSGNHSDAQALSPLSPLSPAFMRSPTASRSAYDLSTYSEQYYADSSNSGNSPQSQMTRRTKTPSGSNSSNSTVTPTDYRGRMSEPPPGVAHLTRKRSSPVPLRPRGMTVGAVDSPSQAYSSPVAATLSPIQPLQVRRKASGSSSPSSSNTPSPSPVIFSRSRTASAASSRVASPVSPASSSGSSRPLVLVRKASASRLPPIPAAPPMSHLPPPPPIPSPYDISPIEFQASSSSSSLNFAPSVDYHDVDAGDAISQLMNDSYDYIPHDVRDRDSPFKSKRRSHRHTYIVDGEVSPVRGQDGESISPLSKFPPVPSLAHGDIAQLKATKFLKKMSSQQNLPQRYSAGSMISSASSPLEDSPGHSNGHPSPSGGKTPRKQRSFHASRVPLPPLPGLRSSGNGHLSSNSDALSHPSSPVLEPRRSSVTSPRKRLFSGSSARRSTSSHGISPADEDKRSVFSFDSDIRPTTSQGIEPVTMSFGTAGGPLSLMTRNACISPSSYWDDPNPSTENKRMSQSEYVPQYIMPPQEQLKLAEKLEDDEATASVQEPEPEPEAERKPKLDLQPEDFGLTYSAHLGGVRSRSNSVMSNQSTGTFAFGPSDKVGVTRGASVLSTKSSIRPSGSRPSTATSPPRKLTLADPIRGPSRASSMLARTLSKPSPLPARPSTAQASLTPPASPSTATGPHSPVSAPSGLLPPPRRRPSCHDLQEIEAAAAKRMSVVPMNPLSPPPASRVGVRFRRQESMESMSAASRPPSAFDRQKIVKRRSLMKKPSFLDIEDEADYAAENGSDEEDEVGLVRPDTPSSPVDGSFLDMDRGKNSFDTVRSMDSAFYV